VLKLKKMSIQIIKAFQKKEGELPEPRELYLNVSEFYCDTIQGEGIYTGCPAAFLRLQGCTLGCAYCDSTEVWRTGEPYLFPELFRMMEKVELIEKFKRRHHLVITGGSPLLQQDQIVLFLAEFVNRYGFLPFIEIENECIFLPHSNLLDVVECWNNSPKLSSSGVKKRKRYKKSILQTMSSLSTSWFKFVIECEEDWEEIRMDFLEPGLIKRSQVILMPLGATRKELFENQEMVVDLAIKHGVRYCSREHIVLWDKNTGV
jgi:7-carboxy-7-deazaguanine synthase